MQGISSLPDELQMGVLRLLPAPDLGRMACVSKQYKRLTDDDTLWTSFPVQQTARAAVKRFGQRITGKETIPVTDLGKRDRYLGIFEVVKVVSDQERSWVLYNFGSRGIRDGLCLRDLRTGHEHRWSGQDDWTEAWFLSYPDGKAPLLFARQDEELYELPHRSQPHSAFHSQLGCPLEISPYQLPDGTRCFAVVAHDNSGCDAFFCRREQDGFWRSCQNIRDCRRLCTLQHNGRWILITETDKLELQVWNLDASTNAWKKNDHQQTCLTGRIVSSMSVGGNTHFAALKAESNQASPLDTVSLCLFSFDEDDLPQMRWTIPLIRVPKVEKTSYLVRDLGDRIGCVQVVSVSRGCHLLVVMHPPTIQRWWLLPDGSAKLCSASKLMQGVLPWNKGSRPLAVISGETSISEIHELDGRIRRYDFTSPAPVLPPTLPVLKVTVVAAAALCWLRAIQLTWQNNPGLGGRIGGTLLSVLGVPLVTLPMNWASKRIFRGKAIWIPRLVFAGLVYGIARHYRGTFIQKANLIAFLGLFGGTAATWNIAWSTLETPCYRTFHPTASN